MEDQNLIGTSFGQSKQGFGNRLDYTKPIYRDKWAMILFYLQVITVLVVSIYFWATEYNNITSSDNSNNNNNSSDLNINMTGVIVTLIACCFAGVIFGLIWLSILKKFASTIIKSMLFLNLFCWLCVIFVGFYIQSTDASDGIYLIIIGIFGFVVFGLYTYCVWHRIPFASALLKISSSITTKYEGTICISFAVIIFNILWYLIWVSSFVAYLVWSGNCNGDGTSDGCQVNGILVFLYLVSFYWGLETWKNISHTTTCGVAATWYFSRDARSPTLPAFKRTMTTSFGSVCFGSLIVSVLQAIRAMVRNMKGGNNYLRCIALCILRCVENLMRYFNTYAFAQCAIYGSSYIQAAKATFELMSHELWKMIVNDDLSGMALNCGAFLGLIVSAGVGYGVSYATINGSGECGGVPCTSLYATLAAIGGIIGFCLCLHILYVVRSAIVCLFVCFAEDPAPLQENHPEEYGWLTGIDKYGQAFKQIEGNNTQTDV